MGNVVSETNPTDASNQPTLTAEMQATVQRIAGLVAVRDCLMDGVALRTVRDAYLTRTEDGNRALLGLIYGMEGESSDGEIFRRVFLPWLLDELLFTPALAAGDPAIRRAAELLRAAFTAAHDSEPAALRLVKK